MVTKANITPTAPTEGLLYCTAVPLTFTEADLSDGSSPDPIPTEAGQAIVATVVLTVVGHVVGNNTYVVLQTDLGEGLWVDLNWCVFTSSDGSGTFVFSNGVAGANSFQQSRGTGATPTPQTVGSNQLTLGGRIRFIGKTVLTAGCSSSIGLNTAQVTATIRYKLLHLR